MQLSEAGEHGISSRDLNIMAKELTPYQERILRVGLFGSRATGRFTTHSDIDLVLFGNLSPGDIMRISTQFQESSISLPVDVCAYTMIDDDLRQHIDRALKLLWSR